MSYKSRAPLSFVVLAFVALLVNGANAQELNQDPGHKEYLSINGLRFSSPNNFDTQRLKSTEHVMYVPHEQYDLGLFVAVTEDPVDAEFVRKLSTLVASYLFPKEKAD